MQRTHQDGAGSHQVGRVDKNERPPQGPSVSALTYVQNEREMVNTTLSSVRSRYDVPPSAE